MRKKAKKKLEINGNLMVKTEEPMNERIDLTSNYVHCNLQVKSMQILTHLTLIFFSINGKNCALGMPFSRLCSKVKHGAA